MFYTITNLQQLSLSSLNFYHHALVRRFGHWEMQFTTPNSANKVAETTIPVTKDYGAKGRGLEKKKRVPTSVKPVAPKSDINGWQVGGGSPGGIVAGEEKARKAKFDDGGDSGSLTAKGIRGNRREG